MSLRDLFRPKWQHSNPDVRKNVVSTIEDQATLEKIVATDADWSVRLSAVKNVTVHTLGSSEGAGSPARWASTAVVRYSKALRCCWRQVSITVSIVSTKRLPAAFCVPKESLRQITACRNARSPALFVGSTPS